jgi:putative serine protease PepD
VLSDVDEDGPAAAAGLRSGDKITSIDKVPVTGTEQLIVTIRTHRPKDVVVLGYERDGSTDTAEVILGSKEG